MGDLTIKKFPVQPKILFMGTPEFAVPSLKALIENSHKVVAVITQPDRPKGRGKNIVPSPVKRVAMAYGLEVLQPEKASAPQFCEIIRKKHPDLLVVVAFGQILNKALLDIPSWGSSISMLPFYPSIEAPPPYNGRF